MTCPCAAQPPVRQRRPQATSPMHRGMVGRTIEAVEKDLIMETLCQCMGNRSQAAGVLGISIRTLRNKLHDYERSGTRIPRPVVVGVA